MPKKSETARAEAERLRAEVAGLETRLARRGDALGNVQLLTRTFVTLTLNDPREIGDTLTSMVSACLGVRCGFTLLRKGEGFQVAGAQGVPDAAALTGGAAQELWEKVLEEGGAVKLSAADLEKDWPARPECLARGAACVSIDVQDRSLGLVVMAGKRSGEEFSAEDLEFLTTAAAAAAMSFSNAHSWAAQQELIRTVEEQAAAAQRDAEEKQRALAELDQKLAIIERQRAEIHQLSTPVLRLWDGVLALPIIGTLDSRRGTQVLERLLKEIPAQKCRYVILDVTGVDVVDTWTADHLMKAVRASHLLGAWCIVTGIRPAVAQSLVQLGIELSSIATASTLQEGLRECLRQREQRRLAKDRVAAARRAGPTRG